MAASLNVVCPHCRAVNRVPATRAADIGRGVCGKCKSKLFLGKPVALDEASHFNKHIDDGDVPVLVDFWAPWCGPCRMMAPEFEKAAAHLEPRMRLAKVNTEAVPELGHRFGVQAIPTMLLFHKGRELARQSGAIQAPGIIRFAETHLAKSS